MSEHALTTAEYLKKTAGTNAVWFSEKRTADVGLRRLRLPVGYVQRVLEARNQELVSDRNAAEMLLMNCDDFQQRFPRDEQVLDVA